ncbi:MAG: hypothetical protein Q8L37_00175 [Candidatus Gottesmanbacteria bacterium]|nr:hypothetical protein [Candidatus Gottesmanbacteria bacterium]
MKNREIKIEEPVISTANVYWRCGSKDNPSWRSETRPISYRGFSDRGIMFNQDEFSTFREETRQKHHEAGCLAMVHNLSWSTEFFE